MARVIDSDYIDSLSLIDGFDIGINFDGFEENVKKLMELPIKYLDSAHDKAVELIEDVNAMLWAPFPDDEVPNKSHEAQKDLSTNKVITGSLPTFVETELVGPKTEGSTPPASLITVENSSTGSVARDAHEAESILTKVPENTSSNGDHIEANDLYLVPEDTSTTEIYDSSTSEEVILWNPEISVKRQRLPEPTTISQDDYVPHALDIDKVTEEVGLHCSGHSDILVESSVFYGAIPVENSSANYEEQMVLYSANNPVEATVHGSISHDWSTDVLGCADDPSMSPHDMIKFVDVDLKDDQEHMKHEKIEDDQEHMKNDKFEASPVHQRNNTSFKISLNNAATDSRSLQKMFMRSLSSKLRWSKKQTNAHQALPARSHDVENLGYQTVSSSDDLEDDWEVVL